MVVRHGGSRLFPDAMIWLRRLLLIWVTVPGAAMAENVVVVLTVHDAIGPATADYLQRGLAYAAEKNAVLSVIKMDTPGGLDLAMRDIIQAINASPVPVAVFVGPSGARAASAGTYILYASHIAAMAPGTNLGAATPVAIGGFPDLGGDEGDDKEQDKKDKKKSKDEAKKAPAARGAMEKKVINDAVAYIRSLAQMRGRNVEWAEKAVREAASLSAAEALKKRVIDLVVDDLGALLTEVHGRKVNVLGRDRTLQTQPPIVEEIEPDWRSELLAVITNPNVAYILMLLGVYGLFFELANPGYVLPGVVGAICLLMALYAFQVLPVNYAGVALILLGIAFMVAEVFAPSFGALGIGGVIAFVVGSVILFETDIEGYSVSIALIAGVALVSAGFFMSVVAMALKFHRRTAVTGAEEMLGSVGEVLDDFQGEGWIRIHGERWRATSPADLRRGQRVRVTAIDGLTLSVEPHKPEKEE